MRHVHRPYSFFRGTALALVFAFLGWGALLGLGIGFWLVFDRIEALAR